MTKLIHVHHEPAFFMHEGGTKFYEVIKFYNADAGKFVMVKRWGKSSSIHAGGEVLIEQFKSARGLDAEADKVMRDKGKRGYNPQGPTTGCPLHDRGTGFKESDDLLTQLTAHYGANADRVFREVTDDWTALSDAAASDDDDVISEEPTPEPDRGDTWGSW